MRDYSFIWYDEMSPVDWTKWSDFIKEKNMNETNVEDLIQASKDQSGRVYQTLKNQESQIKELENLLRSPMSAYITNVQVFNILVDRIGTKGILKMLAER